MLPDLGERNPESLTWNEFARRLLPPDRGSGRVDVPLAALARIDRTVESFEFDANDFKDVRVDEKRLIAADQIRKLADKLGRIPAGPHRITLMREELHARLESRLKQMAGTDEALDELEALEADEQLRIFGELIAPADEQEERALALRYLTDRYADAFAAVENDDWLRIDRIGMRPLGTDGLAPLEWLYLKMALTGLGNPDAKYVMVDEVQDYTAAQLAVLARYFRRAHFLLLGDPNQAIAPDTASFDEVREVFEAARGQVEECRLMTSYRSTPEITALFASLLPPEEQLQRLLHPARRRAAGRPRLRRRRRLRRCPARRRSRGAGGRGARRRHRALEARGQTPPAAARRGRAAAFGRARRTARERRGAHHAQAGEGPRVRPRHRAGRLRARLPRRGRPGPPPPLHHALARHAPRRRAGEGPAHAAARPREGDLMRTFVALDLPPDFADDVAALARQLGAAVEGRFLPRSTYHLTLAFLGEVDEAQAARAGDALDAVCANTAPVVLASDGLGKFGRAGDATLWLGIAPNRELEDLAERLRDELASRNVPFDAKPFKPHITLARRARIPKASLPPLAFPRDDRACTATLYKSTLERTGAVYKPLHSARLDG